MVFFEVEGLWEDLRVGLFEAQPIATLRARLMGLSMLRPRKNERKRGGFKFVRRRALSSLRAAPPSDHGRNLPSSPPRPNLHREDGRKWRNPDPRMIRTTLTPFSPWKVAIFSEVFCFRSEMWLEAGHGEGDWTPNPNCLDVFLVVAASSPRLASPGAGRVQAPPPSL